MGIPLWRARAYAANLERHCKVPAFEVQANRWLPETSLRLETGVSGTWLPPGSCYWLGKVGLCSVSYIGMPQSTAYCPQLVSCCQCPETRNKAYSDRSFDRNSCEICRESVYDGYSLEMLSQASKFRAPGHDTSQLARAHL